MALFTSCILASVMMVSNLAYAQEPVDIVLDTNQMVIVVGIGFAAGVLQAYQGYRVTKEDWDTLKFFDGIIKNTLASIPLAITAALTQTDMNLFTYVTIFFAATGIAVQYSYARKKTVGSNEDVFGEIRFRKVGSKEYWTGIEFKNQKAETLLIGALIRKIYDRDSTLTPKQQQELIQALPGLTRDQMEALMPKTIEEIRDEVEKQKEQARKEAGL